MTYKAVRNIFFLWDTDSDSDDKVNMIVRFFALCLINTKIIEKKCVIFIRAPLISRFFFNREIHANRIFKNSSVCFACVCHALSVQHGCSRISKCTICYGVLYLKVHRFHYKCYTWRKTTASNRFTCMYWRVIHANIGSLS